MAQTRIVMPARAKPGEVIQIKTLIQHHMESGHRRNNMGGAIARDIIQALTITTGAPEYLALELYLAWRGEGLALRAPGVRR